MFFGRILAIPQVLDSEIAEVLTFMDLETESGLERSGGSQKLLLKRGSPFQEINSSGRGRCRKCILEACGAR